MTLLLMAAGSGSRYGKLKQFDDLGPRGEYLMEFAMYDAIKYGFEHIIIITKKEYVQLTTDHMKGRLPANIKLDVIPQEITDIPKGLVFRGERQKPWGTAHAIWTARNIINGPFAVINADDFYGKSAYENAAKFMRAFKDSDTYALLSYTLKNTLSEHGSVSRGLCEVDGEDLISVNERLKLENFGTHIYDRDSGNTYTGEESVSMNFWVCKPSIFTRIETEFRSFLTSEKEAQTAELYIPQIVQDMLQEGNIAVKVVPSGGDWFGVTYASDRESAASFLQQKTEEGDYVSPLWN